MITTTKPALADQIRALLDQATPKVVPGRLLAWWGNTTFPTGTAPAPALTQPLWEATYMRLENAALEQGAIRPLASIEAATRDLRPDEPLPIAIASFRVAVPKAPLAERFVADAVNGGAPGALPSGLGDAIETRHAFMATAFMHGQWDRDTPVHRGRRVRLRLDKSFHFTNPNASLPTAVAVDLGDDHGFRPAKFGDVLEAHYAKGDSAEIAVRCTYGADAFEARFKLAISDDPAPPRPDATRPLQANGPDGEPDALGVAWEFRVDGRKEIVNPVILVEGFPGGHPCDYMYELLNATGLIDDLRSAGYDVVIVGLANGMAPIQRNAQVLVEYLRQVRTRTPQPLVVGGVSMGGLVSRYALAWMEKEGDDHGTATYLSIDAPHRGTYTSLGVQWFVHALAPYAPGLAPFSGLLDSPSNVQLMIAWLHEGDVGRGALRDQLLTDFDKIGGYPKMPRKLAVSCGRGDGVGGHATAGTQTLSWQREPFISMTLNTLPGADGVVADGSWFVAQPPLAPLPDPRLPSWETVPGSQNNYNARVAAIASAMGCGTVEADSANGLTCCVPTVSALDLDQDPRIAIGQDNKGPFDAHTCSPDNLEHLALAREVTEWIVDELGAPPPVGRGAARAAVPRAWDPATFNPFDPAFFRNPYPTYARFREHAPAFAVDTPRPKSLWFFRHADCEEILMRENTFLKRPPGPQDPTGIFGADPPRHTRLREEMGPAFCSAIRGAPAPTDKLITETIGTVAPTGHMEVLTDYADPVASGVLFELLGIPEGDWDKIRRWEVAILRERGDMQPEPVKFAGDTATAALRFYLDGLVGDCQRTGGDGLVGALCQRIGLGLVAEDVALSCYDFIAAGHLSTTWVIASGILSLLEYPDQLRALRLAPAKIDNAITEIVRYEPPFQLIVRVAANDTKVGDTEIKANRVVVAVVGSANRDPSVFKERDPEVLDIDRPNLDRQLGFGGGIHYCIGEPLARVTVPAALQALVTRLPGLELAGLPQWQAADPILRAMTSLPLRFPA
jgi:cytochrome P450